MKKVLWSVFLAVALYSASGMIELSSAAVSKIFGLAGECTGCIYPPTFTILCQSPSVCTRQSAPDWTNANRFYGNDGSNCRVSSNGGLTWGNCASNPSATASYYHYAVAADGSVLAAGNDAGGTVLRIKRSTNNTVSWSTVYESTTEDSSASGHTRLKCTPIEAICVFAYKDVSNNAIGLTSTDDGLTWTEFAGAGTIVYEPNGLVLSTDGGSAMMQPPSSDGFNSFRALIWNGSTWFRDLIWPTTVGGACYEQFILNGALRGICRVGATTNYTLRDSAGVVLTTFTYPEVFTGAITAGLAYSSNTNQIVAAKINTAGNTNLYVSMDAGVSYVKALTVTGTMTNQADTYTANGCTYFSWGVGGSGLFGKAC